jgi:hypothetical protein
MTDTTPLTTSPTTNEVPVVSVMHRPSSFAMSDQLWAFLYLIVGCSMVIATKHLGITSDVGMTIIGAGIQAFTAQQKGRQV